MSSSDPTWLTAPLHEGLVNIGTHSLYLRALGPPQDPSIPLVILEAGGCMSGYSMIAIARHISKFARVYWYDRSGYGNSEKYPEGTPSTIFNHVKCLRALTEAAGIKPPFVLAGHSYGGNIARCFLLEYDCDVAGIVLIDSPPVVPEELPVDAGELLGPEGDQLAVLGLRDVNVSTAEEMQMFEKQETVGAMNGAVMAEVEAIKPGVLELNARQGLEWKEGKLVATRPALGDRRLCIIKGDARGDYEKMYDFGMKHGYGSETAQENSRRFLELWPAERLDQMQDCLVGLSSKSRLVQAEGVGKTHCLTMTVPDFIAENVKWVLKLSD